MQIEANSALAQTIQSAAQAKLMEAGWAAEENDTTLSEYVTMMLVNGQDFQRVQAELGGELLGVGEDDPAVADFTRWLFEQAQALTGPQQQQQQEPDPGATTQEPQVQDDMQGQSMEQDEMMGEGPSADGMYVLPFTPSPADSLSSQQQKKNTDFWASQTEWSKSDAKRRWHTRRSRRTRWTHAWADEQEHGSHFR